jgi:hypothetical protein
MRQREEVPSSKLKVQKKLQVPGSKLQKGERNEKPAWSLAFGFGLLLSFEL